MTAFDCLKRLTGRALCVPAAALILLSQVLDASAQQQTFTRPQIQRLVTSLWVTSSFIPPPFFSSAGAAAQFQCSGNNPLAPQFDHFGAITQPQGYGGSGGSAEVFCRESNGNVFLNGTVLITRSPSEDIAGAQLTVTGSFFEPAAAMVQTRCPAWAPDGGGTSCAPSPNTEAPPKNVGVADPDSGSPTTCFPINIGTGNKYLMETDYVGGSPFPLIIARYYNSTRPEVYGSRLIVREAFGTNWRGHYQRWISLSVFDGSSQQTPTVFANRPDGKAFVFVKQGAIWVADTDVVDKLEQLFDLGGAPVGWRYTSAPNDEIELYDNDGRLLSISNRSGLTQTIAYDTIGRIATITDSFGRTLSYTYDGLSRVQSITGK